MINNENIILKINYYLFLFKLFKYYLIDLNWKIIGDWGLGMGIGDWGLGIGPNPQSPIPNPQSPIPKLIA